MRDGPRVASQACLDSAQTSGVVSALQAALPAVEELARDIAPHYRLELI